MNRLYATVQCLYRMGGAVSKPDPLDIKPWSDQAVDARGTNRKYRR